jgi:Flp pilus assembly protein CpaB
MSEQLFRVVFSPKRARNEVGVSSRRTLILLGAIAVGVVAALLLFNYVRGIEDRAYDNAERVDVFVATADIPRATPGDTSVADGSIDSAKIPREFRPATAITTTDAVQRKVALFDIPQNTVILTGMFVDPASTQLTFRQRLKNPDYVAMTISVDTVRGVGGWLVAGDEVNMLVKVGPQDGEPPIDGFTTPEGATYRYLFQKVQVLAVGDKAVLSPGEQVSTNGTTEGSTGPSGSANAGLLTLNLSPEAAQYVAIAQDAGSIYLSLVAADYVPRELPPLAGGGPLPGEDPAQLTPCGPGGCE